MTYRERFEEALLDFCETEVELLERDVSERSIASKLANYLAKLFPDYDVDVEYDRHAMDPKRVWLEGKQSRVVPDIVIHRRGVDCDNLLGIELKKDVRRLSSRAGRRAVIHDLMKLERLCSDLHYVAGVFVIVPIGNHARASKPTVRWIEPSFKVEIK